MKNIMLCLIVVLFGSAMIYAQDNKEVFVNEKILSDNEYIITARGYSNPVLTDQIKKKESAKDAAILNAQILAAERFVAEFDVITNGSSEVTASGIDWVEIRYTIDFPRISQYMRNFPVNTDLKVQSSLLSHDKGGLH